MPIVRKSKMEKFTTIPNVGLEDPTLSAKAKGVLVYMLSKPDKWVFYQSELQKHFTDGKASIQAAMKELIEHRYLVKGPRERNEYGQLKRATWTVYDTPIPKADYPTLENRQQVETPVNQQFKNENAVKSTFPPNTDLPTLGFPTQANQQLVITDLSNTDLSNNKNNKGNPENQNQVQSQIQNQKPAQTKFNDPVTLWRNNVSFAKTSDVQQLVEWQGDFEELSGNNEANGIVSLAIQQALDADAVNMAYVRTILRSWRDTGVISVAQAKQAIADRKSKQQAKSGQWQNIGQGVPAKNRPHTDLGY